MSRQLTEQQAAVVGSLEGDVAVSAGAGSGKTTVLAQRFAQALKHHGGADGSVEARGELTPDRILTITFTKKAAAEIAERVRRVVLAEMGAGKARLIDTAWISTIHSLCARLVRRHVLEANVDPFFAQADEVTSQALKAEALDEAIKELLDEGVPGAESLFELLSQQALAQTVSTMHEHARAMGLDPLDLTIDVDVDEVARLVEETLEQVHVLIEVIERDGNPKTAEKNLEILRAWSAGVTQCQLGDSEGCSRLVELIGLYKITDRTSTAGEARRAVVAANERLLKATLALTFESELKALEWLVRRYSERFAQIKQARGLLDFDDLQETAVRILESDTALKERYRNQFEYLMVDEFQDTNSLQMRVLAPLRNDNLCIVGDERQSIYGWRYAEVGIFERLRSEMPRQLQLSKNFRSHPDVLGFVNALFSQAHLFGASFMRLDPGLQADCSSDGGADVRVSCRFFDGEKVDVARRAEAEWMAQTVSELAAKGYAYGDCAVLLRSAKSAGLYAAALEALGIPVYVTAGQSLFEEQEAGEITALLRAIAVPHDDEALLTVLASRVVAASDDALLALSRVADKGPLWHKLRIFANDSARPPEGIPQDQMAALEHAFRAIDSLNSSQGRMRLSELAREAALSFDYDITLHALGAQGVRAWANVEKICRYADAYEQAESNDLAGFVEYLNRRADQGGDQPAAGETGDTAVRIMTVHSAKGLEFPVVFVADLASAQCMPSPTVLVTQEQRDGKAIPVAGVRLADLCTPAYLRMEPEHRLKEIEEQKRCLYVALTRAKERLFVSGACDLGKPAEEGKALIDWVRMGVGDERGVLEIEGISVECVDEVVETPSETSSQESDRPQEPGAPIFCPQPEPERVAGDARIAPRTVSYSSLQKLQRCPLSFHAEHGLGLRSFKLDDDHDALRVGTAVHAALRSMVLRDWSEERATALARQHRLTPQETDRVTSVVSGFSASEWFDRVQHASSIHTECPVSVPLGDETLLVGSADLVAWEAEGCLIVDYKTGKGPGEAPERSDEHRLQAECYALAALKAGASRVEVAFVFVEKEMQVEKFEFSAGDANGIEQRLMSLVDQMLEGEITHLESYQREICEECVAFGQICPIGAKAASA